MTTSMPYPMPYLGARPLRLRPPQMLVEPRHDLDEVAGARAVIELGGEDAVPGVAAGARRSRQAEDEGCTRNASSRPALHRRGADLGVAQHVKGDGETIHALFEQRLDRLRRHIASGKTGAAGGDDGVDARVSDPCPHDVADLLDIVGRD